LAPGLGNIGQILWKTCDYSWSMERIMATGVCTGRTISTPWRYRIRIPRANGSVIWIKSGICFCDFRYLAIQ